MAVAILLIFVIGSLAVSGCAAPASELTLDIGVASTLTGPPSALGTQLKNGALVAIEDQNNEGGITIAGEKYMLNPIVMDTKGNPQDGKAVAEQLIFDKKVKIIQLWFTDILEFLNVSPLPATN